MTDRICVNMLGGPSSGKSVAAAALFVNLKRLHVDCELVTEVAKDLVYESNKTALSDQILVFANTLYKTRNAYNNTKVAVVDSPLLLSAIYNPNTSKHLVDLVFEQYRKFNNLNIFVNRDPSYPHSMNGRIHSLTESITIDNQIIRLLETHDIPYIRYDMIDESGLIDLICKEIGHAEATTVQQTRLERGSVAA